MTLAINSTYATYYYAGQNDKAGCDTVLAIAQTEIDAGIETCDENPGTSVAALRGFLIFYNVTIGTLNETIASYPLALNTPPADGIFEYALYTLYSSVHMLVDEGLPE